MSAASLIEIIRQEILKIFRNEFNGFELATVVSPYPNLVIKVDNMKVELTRQDLVICQSLLSNTRIVSILSRPGTVRELGSQMVEDSNSISLGSGTVAANTSTADYHSHVLNSFTLDNPSIEMSYVQMRFEDVLKAGDRVLVQAIPGGQKYIVVDRVVEYE